MRIRTPETNQQDPVAWATLMWHGAVGAAGFARLLARFGSARATMLAPNAELAAPSLKLRPGQVASIQAAGDRLDETAHQIDDLKSREIALACSFEPHYPAPLRQAKNPPPVICIRGSVLSEDEPGLAIVGTREPTDEGRANARAIARACSERGVTIVSGLAIGVDSAAHRGALDAGGRGIAILGSGLCCIRPTRNTRMAAQIADYGAVISETPPEAHPSAARLLARNRLTAALCQGLVAVEATGDGGTMRTVRDAIGLGRLVFACDWQADKTQADGTRAALGLGAEPILGPDAADFIVAAIRNHRPTPPAQSSLL